MAKIRSFIAIEIPPALKEELSLLETRLKSRLPAARWVDPKNMHLTLKFLGDVDEEKIKDITGAIEEACRETSPFRMVIKGVGAFPSLERIQVVWAGINGDLDQLMALAQRIEATVSPLGFPPEDRPFSSHLTLARLGNRIYPEERRRFSEYLARYQFAAETPLDVNSVNLMRSELTPIGPIYSILNTVKLGAQP